MIGNDIVDLTIVSDQSNWRRERWLQKIFTEKERHFIYNSEDPDLLVWKFWSMKESVYKAYQRSFNLSPVYNPRSFECNLNGEVYKENLVYETDSQINTDRIYTIAAITIDSEKVISKIVKTYSKSKTCFFDLITSHLSVHNSRIVIQKNENRIPQIFVNNRYVDLNFSFTRHGRFSACVVENSF